MPRELKCPFCGSDMFFWLCEKIQLGQESILWGSWGNIMAGAMKVDVYACPNCSKIEFFAAENLPEPPSKDDPNLLFCPQCGRPHNLGFNQCPYCDYKYKTCPKCSKLHANDLEVCPGCGHDYGKKKKLFSKHF